MHTALKILSITFVVLSIVTLILAVASIGASVASLPEYKQELTAKIAEERPKLLVDRPEDVSNNLRSLWAAHTVDHDLTIFFLTRGAFSMAFFLATLFLWVIALQLQILALITLRKANQSAP